MISFSGTKNDFALAKRRKNIFLLSAVVSSEEQDSERTTTMGGGVRRDASRGVFLGLSRGSFFAVFLLSLKVSQVKKMIAKGAKKSTSENAIYFCCECNNSNWSYNRNC